MSMHHQGPVWPGPGPQPPTWPAPPPVPKPERGPRPDDVKLSVQLWIFVIIASVTSLVAQSLVLRDSDWLRQGYESAREGGSSQLPDGRNMTFAEFQTGFVLLIVLVVVAGAAAAGVLVYLMWRGQGWARMVLQFVAAFVLVQGVQSFFSRDATVAIPAILAAIAVIGAIITANSRDSLEYFNPGVTAARR
ncbi:hypothetical protein ACFWXB_20475 [Tsukamurella tyrosinosolvens]|uniref:hypothetical protein n=1 Tax=Tsukamurella tyrosinosolvens TaxID=57704 RepID=UPI001AF42C96|nr:hypothetical protein [Tsukamurella tyrosinosolvens]MEC4613142.1 hypothetical protein [Tsukamurella tyrosinosolvens]QRY85926.1 hypothetical protein JVY00_07670 [Tsukamurella tyrosinosolvens]